MKVQKYYVDLDCPCCGTKHRYFVAKSEIKSDIFDSEVIPER